MANDRCPNCGARVDPGQPDCPECHHEVPEDVLEAAEAYVAKQGPEARAKKHKWPIPWGLFIALGVYWALVTFYTRYEYINSPQYKASRYLRVAAQLMGDDDGKTVPKEVLLEAAENLLLAIKHVPENTWAQQRVEVVARRLQERGMKIPKDLQKQLDALAMKHRVAMDAKKGVLPIGAYDIWDIEGAKQVPFQVAQRGVLGGLVILVVWLYKTMQDRKAVAAIELSRDTERARELRALGRPRRRLKQSDAKPYVAPKKKRQ
ncbi:MAG: zinc ribbon domain-containing protein [Myxococcales bacterium]